MATTTSFTDDAASRFGGLDEESTDVVVVDELQQGNPDEGKIVLTKEQYEELNRKTDSTTLLSQGFQSLAERLTPQQVAPRQQEAPAPTLPELDMKELEREAFSEGGFAKAVSKLTERQIGQILAPLAQSSIEQQKKLLELDPNTKEYFTKYAAEIEAKVQAAPPNLRYTPKIYEMAYKQVLFDHQQDIIQAEAEKRTQAIVDEAVKKALAEAGVGAGAVPQKRVAMYQENTTVSAVPSNMAAERSKGSLTITAAEAEAMRLKAMDPKDPDQVRSFIKYYRRGK